VDAGPYTVAVGLDSNANGAVESVIESIVEKSSHLREYTDYKLKLLEINRLRQKISGELTRIV